MKHTQINPGLGRPRAGITMRPKLARSCWFDTMMGKSLRKTGTGRETEQAAQGSLLLASSQQGVSPSRSIQQGTVHSQCTACPCWFGTQVIPTLF
jgi:hypothetical protein